MSLRANVHQATDPQAPLGPSPSVWADCPVLELMNPVANMGWFIRENWEHRIQLATMVTTVNENGYYPLLSAASTIVGNTTAVITPANNGVRNYLRFYGDNADNLAAGLQYAGMTSTPTGIINIDDVYGKMWFETIVRPATVVTGELNLLVGLRDITASTVADMADDATDIADITFVGFTVWQDDGDSLDAIYQTAGSAFGTVAANAGTLTLATWTRLGITYEHPTVSYFINGAKVGTVDIHTAGFPNGVVLTPEWFFKKGAAVVQTNDVGWWQAAQLY